MGMKMTVLVRKDLNMRKGKMIAQAMHGVTMLMYEALMDSDVKLAVDAWMADDVQKKIVLGVADEVELEATLQNAENLGLRIHRVIDNGLTEFHGVKTQTCAIIGPDEETSIDLATSMLNLL